MEKHRTIIYHKGSVERNMIRYIGFGMILTAVLLYLFFWRTSKARVKSHLALKSACVLLAFWGATFTLYSFDLFWTYMIGAVLVIVSDVIVYLWWKDALGKSEKELERTVVDIPNMRCVKMKECVKEDGTFRYFMEMADTDTNQIRFFTYLAKIEFLEVNQYYMINRKRILELSSRDVVEHNGQNYIDITKLPMSGFEQATQQQILKAVGMLG